MTDIEFVTPQINNNIIQKEISIQVSLNGFSFLILSADKSYLAFKHYNFNKLMLIDELIRKVEQILISDKLLQFKFSSTKITFVSQKATLVPKEFFNLNNLKKLFEFNHSMNELDELHHTYIPTIEAYTIFTLPSYLSNAFHDRFNSVEYNHQASHLINYASQIKGQENKILLNINSNFFDIVIFENDKLLLYNSFQYTTPFDFIYFYLYPLNQLKINPKKQYVHVFGNIKQNKGIITELKKNAFKIILPRIESILPDKIASKIEQSEFYSLLQ